MPTMKHSKPTFNYNSDLSGGDNITTLGDNSSNDGGNGNGKL